MDQMNKDVVSCLHYKCFAFVFLRIKHFFVTIELDYESKIYFRADALILDFAFVMNYLSILLPYN